MPEFQFFHPITVRYGDLDPQGHVNNAAFITYLEHARVSYIRHLGLWDGVSFQEIGFILARIEMDYRAPIQLTDLVEIGVRVSRLGNKSLVMEYLVRENNNTLQKLYPIPARQMLRRRSSDIWKRGWLSFQF
jgi:acyl-CoA thioester hydrolase